MTTLANRIHAFLHPLDAVQAQVALFNSQRHLWTEKYKHLLVTDLENRPQWVIEEGGKAVTFIDEWFTKEGESVSRAVHHLDTKPLTTPTVAGDVS